MKASGLLSDAALLVELKDLSQRMLIDTEYRMQGMDPILVMTAHDELVTVRRRLGTLTQAFRANMMRYGATNEQIEGALTECMFGVTRP